MPGIDEAALIIGGASVIGGIASMFGDDPLDEANKLTAQQLELAREDRARWEEVYGPIERNLSATVAGLTPELFAAAGILQVNKEFEQVSNNLRTRIAQRNLGGSGLQLDLENQLDIRKAEAKASVRADAPLKVLNAKNNFLSIGLGRAGNDSSREQQLLGQQAAILRQQSAAQNQASIGLISAGANLIGGSGVLDKAKTDEFDFSGIEMDGFNKPVVRQLDDKTLRPNSNVGGFTPGTLSTFG